MARPRFSEILLERRRELGLSIGQASRILKLREDVLVAFEEGDYDHMPQSGYAQGMLSSYARYLGLNAREIVDLFQEELYEHRHGTSSHELRRRTRQTQAGRGVSGYDLVNEVGSRPKAYVEYRPLLPSSGGPAGDMGYFATTSPARSSSSVPLPSAAPLVPASRTSYSSQGYRTYEQPSARHPYNQAPSRERGQGSTARRRAAGQRRRSDGRSREDLRDRSFYRRDDVSTRRVRPSEYTDDMRLDDRPNPYAPASTISGRRSSRNIASVERPNVRRRGSSAPGRGSSGRGSGRPPARGGLVGTVETFFSDPRRALFAIIVLCAAVLTAILVLSVGSCVSGRAQSRPEGQTVAVNSATQGGDASAADSSADDAAGDDADADADEPADAEDPDAADEGTDPDSAGGDAAADGEQGADSAEEEPKETIVEVSVASGGYSWVEVLCDGVSEVAEGVTGPWSQSYNVHDSITVQVADTSVVTVTENGEPADFTSHAGGVASVTIKGTPLPEPAEGEATDGSDGQSADGASDGTDQTYY